MHILDAIVFIHVHMLEQSHQKIKPHPVIMSLKVVHGRCQVKSLVALVDLVVRSFCGFPQNSIKYAIERLPRRALLRRLKSHM